MAVIEGTQVRVGYDTTDTAFADSAAVKTAFFGTTPVLLDNVTDVGSVEQTANIIEYSVYDHESVQKLVGLDTPGDFTVDIAFDPNDSNHQSLANGAGSTARFGVEVDDGTNQYYWGMRGLISSAAIAAPIDGIATLSVTVALKDQIIAGTGS